MDTLKRIITVILSLIFVFGLFSYVNAANPYELEEDDDTSYMLGDFDKDNEITVADALSALRIAVKLAQEDEFAIAVGDIDSDGHITVSDALVILRVAAGVTEKLR